MKPTDLRGILNYIPRFRDRIFVIGIDGAIVSHPNFPNILLDIAVLRSLNIRVVIAHGIAAQIRALAEKQRIQPSDIHGAGLTDLATLELAIAASNQVTHDILRGLATHHLRGALSNAIVAYPRGIIHGRDQQHTGKVEKVDATLLQQLIGYGISPIIPPLGFDGEGTTYRVNSDSIALSVGQSLGAAKLIYLTPLEGLKYHGRFVRQISVPELDQWLAETPPPFPPLELSKARHAAAACRAGIPRAHIIDGRVDGALLTEVFSSAGIGTLVHANEYEQIRGARKTDVPILMQLTRDSTQNDELQHRGESDLRERIQDYYLFEIDRNPVACVALHAYPELKKGELASLCVSPVHENRGIGRKLVRFVEEKARELQLEELFVLSTQAYTFFGAKAGFQEDSPEILPPDRRRQLSASGRNSKILTKRVLPADQRSAPAT